MPNTPGNPNLQLENRICALERAMREQQTQAAYVAANSSSEAQAVLGNLAPTTGVAGAGVAVRNGAGVWEKQGSSAWTALASVNGDLTIVVGFAVPAVRSEGGGARAYVRGLYEVTAEIAAGAALFTVPVAFRPPNEVDFSIGVITSGAEAPYWGRLTSSTGVVTVGKKLIVGQFVLFDSFSHWALT